LGPMHVVGVARMVAKLSLWKVKRRGRSYPNVSTTTKKMQYKATSRSTNLKPCTNIPLICTICPPVSNRELVTFWKYEFITHMMDKHLTKDNELPVLLIQLWATTHISKWEEFKMGIPVHKTHEWRDANQVLDSDNVNIIWEEDNEDNNIYVEEEVAISVCKSGSVRFFAPKTGNHRLQPV